MDGLERVLKSGMKLQENLANSMRENRKTIEANIKRLKERVGNLKTNWSGFLLFKCWSQDVKSGSLIAFLRQSKVKSAFHIKARACVELKLIELALQKNYKLSGLCFKVLDVTSCLLHHRNTFLQKLAHCSFQLFEGTELSLLEMEVIDDVDHLHRLVFNLLVFFSLLKSEVLASLSTVCAWNLKYPAIIDLLVREAIVEELIATDHTREEVHSSYFIIKYSHLD